MMARRFKCMNALMLGMLLAGVAHASRSLLQTTGTQPGGAIPASIDDPGVQDAAAFCIQRLNSNTTSMAIATGTLGVHGNLTALDLFSADSQVVQGSIYHVKLCVEDESNSMFDMSCTVWSRPWLAPPNKMILTGAYAKEAGDACAAAMAAAASGGDAPVVGGWEQGDPQTVVEEAAFCVDALNNDVQLRQVVLGANASTPVELLVVEDVWQQVVSGWLYNLTMQVVDNSSRRFVVHFQVWTQPWMPEPIRIRSAYLLFELVPKRPTNSTVYLAAEPDTSSDDPSPTKPGGTISTDSTDDDVQAAAGACTDLLSQDYDWREKVLGTYLPDPPFSLVSVQHADQQVVAGTLYNITMTIEDMQPERFPILCQVLFQAWQPTQPYTVVQMASLGPPQAA